MNTKFFGQFLFEKGIINKNQLLEALDEQRKTSPLLGDIAIEKQWLDEKQASTINMEQRRQDKRFGEIAIERLWLDEKQIEELLANQRERRKYFGEILVELGYLFEKDLEMYLTAHKKSSLDFNSQIDSSFDNTEMSKQALLINNSFTSFYQRMLKTLTSISSVSSKSPSVNSDQLFWSQKIQSNKKYCLIIAMNKEHACIIATNFIGVDVTDIDELAIDAVSEFLNTFVGHVYSKLDDNGQKTVNAPQYHAEQLDLNLTSCSTLQFDSGQFQIQVAIGMEN